MYCKYCGKPIDEGTMRCRICGRPVGPLEGGNGFWDLVEGKNSSPEVQASRNDAALKKLETEVDQLRKKLEEQPVQKKSALPILAGLLGLLALAMGVFALFQLQVITGKVQTLDRRLAEQDARISSLAQQPAETPQETPSPEEGQAAFSAESKWKGLYELEGIPLQPGLTLFEGPNKGENDERGQSINLGEPADGSEVTTIFTARFIGPPGTYQYFWVRLENEEGSDITYFNPIREDNEEGFAVRRPNASDKDKTYKLFIEGAVTREHLGRYAFVVEDLQTRSAYVSQIVELYDRAEQGRSAGTGDANGG